MTKLRFGSVCSGIEAASTAWSVLGWEAAFFSEIEPFPCAVLAHHHPSVPNLGDMTKFQEWPDFGTVDLIVGGTPCQSFSVAGLRAGMDDPRGNLALTYLAIAAKYRPKWLVWENVPGVLSSNKGRDFGSILGGMGELGYGVAYRVLDAQFCRTLGFAGAVPQRRRRVFVVGYLGDWRRAAAVLFDGTSLRGDSAPRRQAGKVVAPTISARPTGGGGLGTDFDLDGGLIAADVAPTLNAHFGDKLGLENQHINGGGACSFAPPVSLCLNAGGMGRIDAESETLLTTGGVFDVAHTLKGEGFDASEDGTGRGTPLIAVSDMLTSNGDAHSGFRDHKGLIAEPIVMMERGRADGPNLETRQDGTANAILTPNGGRGGLGVGAVAIQAGALRENPTSGPDGIGVQSDVAYTVEARAEVQAVQQAWAVRRLTPTECERLQGFPDGYTQVPYRNKVAADGPRYKALGNSMAVNVMRVIGSRIAMVEAA